MVALFTFQQLVTLSQLKTKRENVLMFCFFLMDYVYLYLQYNLQPEPLGAIIGFLCTFLPSSLVLYGLVPWFLFPFSTYQYVMIVVGIVVQGYLTTIELAKDTIYTLTREKMRTLMMSILVQVVLVSIFYASLVGLMHKVLSRAKGRHLPDSRAWRCV